MIVTQKHLSRRTVLRGLGATLALPLLYGMVPAFAQMRNSAAKPVRRLAAVYVPNGMNIWKWTPAAEGRNFELGPILDSLEPFRDRLLVLTGMCNPLADPAEGEAGGDHPRAQASWLTGVHVKRTQGSDIRAGTSMDQIAAAHFSKETQLASLELALEAAELAGGCDGGYSCTYTGTISYKTPTTPLPMEVDPRAVFERLFGATDSTDTKARMIRLQTERSILDSVTEETAGLEKKLGAGDRIKLSQYLEAVRDIERRIELAEKQSDRELPVVQKAGGIPATFEEHAKMMFDLQALAWQTDLTRVASMLMGRESTGHTYPEIGVPEAHHPTSHHAMRPELLEKLAKINAYHVKMFAYLLDRLRSTPDGDGNLLDHSMLIYGAGFSNSDQHLHHNLPVLLAGGGAGQLKGGRHIRYADETPIANLHASVLDLMGVPVTNFGDATGRLEGLTTA